MHRLSTTAILGLAALSLLAISPERTYAQGRIPAGAVAAQLVGRARLNADFSINVYGYFTFMEGIQSPMFAGSPGENTALFTFSAQPTNAALLANGDMLSALENPVNGQYTTLTVYYNPSPSSRDIANPDDFTQGVVVAQFRSRGAAVNVLPSKTFQASGGLSFLSAGVVVLNGQTLTLDSLVSSLSLNLFGPAPSFDDLIAGLAANGSYSLPFAGTATAVALQ